MRQRKPQQDDDEFFKKPKVEARAMCDMQPQVSREFYEKPYGRCIFTTQFRLSLLILQYFFLIKPHVSRNGVAVRAIVSRLPAELLPTLTTHLVHGHAHLALPLPSRPPSSAALLLGRAHPGG